MWFLVRGTYIYVDDVDMTVYIGMIHDCIVRYKIVPYFGMRFAIFSILLQQSDIIFLYIISVGWCTIL